jgi:hypothetical protein
MQQSAEQSDKPVLPDALVGRQVFLEIFSEHELSFWNTNGTYQDNNLVTILPYASI